jgi:hypothetical protein
MGKLENGKERRLLHLRVEEAGRRLDDAGGATVGLDLEDGALRPADDGEQLEDDVLGVHVEDEVEGQGLLLAGLDLGLVVDGRQVAQDAGAGGRAFGQRLGGEQTASHPRYRQRAIFLVGDLNQRLGRPAIDELDAEDVRVGEGGGDVRLQLRLVLGGELGRILRRGATLAVFARTPVCVSHKRILRGPKHADLETYLCGSIGGERANELQGEEREGRDLKGHHFGLRGVSSDEGGKNYRWRNI